mgnify:CR=1 FL=1
MIRSSVPAWLSFAVFSIPDLGYWASTLLGGWYYGGLCGWAVPELICSHSAMCRCFFWLTSSVDLTYMCMTIGCAGRCMTNGLLVH